jgi:hypothetical protein
MEESESRAYYWYVLGCRQFEWEPLSAKEFWPQFKRYRRCSRAIRKYQKRREERLGKGGLFALENRFLERLMRVVTRERDRLDYLANAVAAGQKIDPDSPEDGGVPVLSRTDPPVLVGAAAKLLPPLDPEPAWRDP